MAITKRVRYDVYKNLHNGKWSIRDAECKLVIGHADSLELAEAKFKVSEAGRQRVIREGRKNVHAFITGIAVNVKGFVPFKGRVLHSNEDDAPFTAREWHRITYNPYKMEGFTVPDVGEPWIVDRLPSVILTKHEGVWGTLDGSRFTDGGSSL